MTPEQVRALPEGQPVPSPCINVCSMDAATGLCRGCLRNIDEIVAWGTASDAYKRRVWAQIERRQADQFK